MLNAWLPRGPQRDDINEELQPILNLFLTRSIITTSYVNFPESTPSGDLRSYKDRGLFNAKEKGGALFTGKRPNKKNY